MHAERVAKEVHRQLAKLLPADEWALRFIVRCRKLAFDKLIIYDIVFKASSDA